MLGFIGDHYFVIPIAAGIFFTAIISFVSIEDALRRH